MENQRWPALRNFLRVPDELTGKGVRIAVVDGEFQNHPDISTDERRTTHLVRAAESEPHPALLQAKVGPWTGGAHALWVAAAAAGSGAESQGLYKGVAPEADLFLIARYLPEPGWDEQLAPIKALEWVRSNWRKYEIRGVLIAHKGRIDSGLLPWQTDPHRIMCEKLAAEGVLVVGGSGNVPDLTAAMTHAAAPSVLSVGGVAIPPDGNPCRAEMYQGCRGTTFEGKWVPEILAPADNIVLPYRTDEEIDNHFYGKTDDLPRRYARTNGTSFSGPAMLGAAACLWQAHPDWTAQQMKAALVATSLKRPQWSDLRAGLVSIRSALVENPSETAQELVTHPYQHWSSWRKKSLHYKLDQLNGNNPDDVKEAILSLIGAPLPDQAVNSIYKHIKHPEDSVRAAALCALTSRPSHVSSNYISDALQDTSPSVQMAAVYLLKNCPDLWPECSTSLSRLFEDASLDIRYESLRLAKKMAHPDFAEKIVAGLEEDAWMVRVANFTARTDALEAITGQQLLWNPPFVWGQLTHGDACRDARMDLARRWKNWLNQDWLAGRE
jgi:hypothetical protein